MRSVRSTSAPIATMSLTRSAVIIALLGLALATTAVVTFDMYSGFEGPDVGKEKLLHVLDVEKITPEIAADYRAKLLKSKTLTSLILHLAEGRRGDRESISH